MTDEFSKFLCWDPKRVGDVIKTDASSLPPSTLLAVHHYPTPPSIGDPRYFSDDDVFAKLMDPNENHQLLAVIGDAGAGKSHLIQWIDARLETNTEDVVIYLPRSGTGLRGLLEKLVDALGKAGAAEEASLLQSQLESAFSSTESDEITAERLLFRALCIASMPRVKDLAPRFQTQAIEFAFTVPFLACRFGVGIER